MNLSNPLDGDGWIMVFMDDEEYHFFEKNIKSEEKQNGKYYTAIESDDTVFLTIDEYNERYSK